MMAMMSMMIIVSNSMQPYHENASNTTNFSILHTYYLFPIAFMYNSMQMSL